MTYSRRVRGLVGACVVCAIVGAEVAPLGAAGDRDRAEPSAQGAPDRSGTSLAEKIACVYLLVGGSIMLYYGPREKDSGVLTMDGKSEAVGGAGAIVLSVALLRDIVKKRRPHS